MRNLDRWERIASIITAIGAGLSTVGYAIDVFGDASMRNVLWMVTSALVCAFGVFNARKLRRERRDASP